MTYKEPVLYFGFGSNLWLDQMKQRCPNSPYMGIGRLRGYKWIINERGYANVVECNQGPEQNGNQDNEDYVYGLIYALSTEDEKNLDVNEGVPWAYTKEYMQIDFWSSEGKEEWIDVGKSPQSQTMLVYIDRKRTGPAEAKKEYCHRMNMGAADAVALGVPKAFVKQVIREFIPEGDADPEARSLAQKQAMHFNDEN